MYTDRFQRSNVRTTSIGNRLLLIDLWMETCGVMKRLRQSTFAHNGHSRFLGCSFFFFFVLSPPFLHRICSEEPIKYFIKKECNLLQFVSSSMAKC